MLIQVTHAAQNHARTEAFVPPLEKKVMNATARELDILGQIARHVSVNGTQVKATLLSWSLIPIRFLASAFPAEFLTWVKVSLKPSPNTVHYLLTHFKGFWNIVNSISFLRDAIMRYVLTCKFPDCFFFICRDTFILTKRCFWFLFSARSHLIDSPPTFNADYDYKSWEAYSNLSYYTRTLPPVARDCPTPMGVVGEFCSVLLLKNQFFQILLSRIITSSSELKELKPK